MHQLLTKISQRLSGITALCTKLLTTQHFIAEQIIGVICLRHRRSGAQYGKDPIQVLLESAWACWAASPPFVE